MTTTGVRAGVVRLVDRDPVVSGAEMLAQLVPPPQFATATFASYRADPEYPSQQHAKDALGAFVGVDARSTQRRRGWRRTPAAPTMRPGVYLDGGFGIGKTHLLAAAFHASTAPRKYFGSFIEYTALVGALGYRSAVDLLRGAGLVCIDEFELDDPGDTMVMTRLLRELVASGSRIAATSNTPPHALGEGRFAARDFLREITAMAADFDVLRMDGVDFRQRALDGHARVLEEDAYAQAIASAASRSIASDDAFSDLVAHLARVHPSRYARMIDDIGLIGVRGAVPLADQSAALRWVAFVDRVYDAQIPVRSTGTALDEVFAPEMLAGGYRKKYLRAASRLIALTHLETSGLTSI